MEVLRTQLDRILLYFVNYQYIIKTNAELFQEKQKLDIYNFILLGFQAASGPSTILIEHFPFVYILKQKLTKKFAFLNNKFRGSSKFNENRICWRLIFETLIILKPSLGSCEVPKFWSDQLSRFDVYWIQTNKQTDKQSIYFYFIHMIYYYWDGLYKNFSLNFSFPGCCSQPSWWARP